MLLASILHDFKHPGLNNFYHINARTDIAITYNGNIYFYFRQGTAGLSNGAAHQFLGIFNNRNPGAIHCFSKIQSIV